MKVFIPTLNREKTINTPWAWEGMDYLVVCHTEEQREAYLREQPRLLPERVVVSGAPTGIKDGTVGINAQRKWIVNTYAQSGEWLCIADDNISHFAGVPERYASLSSLPVQEPEQAAGYDTASWKALFSHTLSESEMERILASMIEQCDRDDIWLAGFATTDNHYFLGRHWRRTGFVCSKIMLWKHDPTWPWDSMEHIDDYHYSAENHLRHGRVLVNNWVIPVSGHYQPGGIGPYHERIPYRRQSVERLVVQYAGLLRPKQRRGFEPNTELAFRLTTEAQVDKWRENRLLSSHL